MAPGLLLCYPHYIKPPAISHQLIYFQLFDRFFNRSNSLDRGFWVIVRDSSNDVPSSDAYEDEDEDPAIGARSVAGGGGQYARRGFAELN